MSRLSGNALGCPFIGICACHVDGWNSRVQFAGTARDIPASQLALQIDVCDDGADRARFRERPSLPLDASTTLKPLPEAALQPFAELTPHHRRRERER